MDSRSFDTQATFFATLVEEWVRGGIVDAVVAPGHRSTILAATLIKDGRLRVHVMVDERSAAFFALGLGAATGKPALFWCTSGTAAAEAHAAVIEADLGKIPLLVCTADRPPELHHSRDWQSIDQSRLYGASLRWQFDPGVADDAMAGAWRSIAARSVTETMFHPQGPGPVHLNLPIREPWKLEAGPGPAGREHGKPWHSVDLGAMQPGGSALDALVSGSGKRGVIVVGRAEVDPDAVHACAQRLGWPVIAEARSGCRTATETTIGAAHDLLSVAGFAASHVPEIVLRIGTPVLSKAVAGWLHDSQAEEWLLDRHGVWEGPALDVDHIIVADPTLVCLALAERVEPSAPSDWLAGWRHAESTAQEAIGTFLEAQPEPTEPAIARAVITNLDAGNILFAGTSMPVRCVEWYAAPREGIRILANRGASGMDGVISTAAGVAAATSKPTVLLIGDLTALYDLNALWALRGVACAVNLTVVVIDNDGGGIFNNFPQLSSLGVEVFERVVATPQGVNIVAVAQALDVESRSVASVPELVAAIKQTTAVDGLSLIRIPTDRRRAPLVLDELKVAVATALT